MSPNKTRKRVRDYLLQQETYVNSLRQSIAKRNLQKKRAALGISSEVTQNEIQFYLITHYEDIDKEVSESVKDLTVEAIPDSQWIFLLKNIGVLAIVLLPPIYPLATYISELLSKSPIEYDKVGAVIVGILLLTSVFLASFYAFIRDSWKTKI